ncbi:MAG TPA: PAS domain S-box protein [Kofleriaceae bacterium]|nr:PAS domain S-box protein [Kofleriaceae bacterium]
MHREQILASWSASARHIAASAGRREPALARNMSPLVDEITRVLSGEARIAGPVATDCVAELLESAAPLSQLVRELTLLRRCILRSWRALNPTGSGDEASHAAAAIDSVVEHTVDRYLELRTNILEAYEQIALAAMDASTIDQFLHALVAVLTALPMQPGGLALFVRDAAQLQLRASCGRVPTALPVAIPVGDVFAAIDGWFGVPLLDGQEVAGLALLACPANRELSNTERQVFALVARRAVPAIAQYQRRSEARKRTAELDVFIEAIESPVYFGTAERFWNANRAGLELVGVDSVDELRELDVAAIVERLQLRDAVGEMRPRPEQSAFARALAGERVSSDCCAVHCRHGTPCYFRCVAGPVLIDGRLEGTVLVLSDVTAIKLGEDRFRMMFERIPMAIAQSDPANGTVVRANAKMCELTGYALDELLGRSFADWTHPDDRRNNMEQYHRMVAGELDIYTTEKRYIRKDGAIAWVRVTASLLPSPGEPARTLATIEDITERRAAEREREEAAEFRERFLAIVSHDLRNPLNAIMLTSQRLAGVRDLPSVIGTGLARIRSSANRMAQMIAELLDLTRGRLGGGIPIETTHTDLHEIVRASIDELELANPGRRIALRATGEFDGQYDRERLAQVASNLIGNALHHGGEDGAVEVALVDHGADGIALVVRNGGSPIPVALIPHLFEPFRRGATSSGLGLGLYIASEIVHAHRGTIEVTSTASEGTTFTVRLPREPRNVPTTSQVRYAMDADVATIHARTR